MSKSTDVIVLAAGRGQRLRANSPKPLAILAGQPLIAHVLAAAAKIKPRRIVAVVPPNAYALRKTAAAAYPEIQFAVQESPRGTANAALQGARKLDNSGTALVLCADAPLLSAATLQKLRRAAKQHPALLCFHTPNPRGYGRIVRRNGKTAEIVEEKHANARQKQIQEVFAGALAADNAWLKSALPKLRPQKSGGETYLTEIAALAMQQNSPATTVAAAKDEAAGINTPAELAEAENALRKRRAQQLADRGAQIADHMRLDVRGDVRCGQGAEIDVNVILSGSVVLGRGCKIGANCVIADSVLGADTHILPFCHIEGANIGARCAVGPFARIRPQTAVKQESRIGNFVEVKNSALGAKVKAGHLAYLGDAEIGKGVNIGAGAITCNYDGKTKHKTRIGEGAFIGSGVQLVAPVKVGRGAYVAAGTALAKDAPPDMLTLARPKQTSRRKKK